MSEIQIITPPVADMTDALEFGLVSLTEAIGQIDPESVAHGVLGGYYGYGAIYENDVFVMRPFYWGDCDCGWDKLESDWCDNHSHSDDCYQGELRRERMAAGWKETKYGYLDRPDELSYDAARKIENAIYKRLCEKHGMSLSWGCAVHCTCDYEPQWKAFLNKHGGHKPTCSLELPNFQHKGSGLEVRWYKWIGRDTEITNDNGLDYSAIIQECLSSLPAQGDPNA